MDHPPFAGATNARPLAANFVAYLHIRRNSTKWDGPGVLIALTFVIVLETSRCCGSRMAAEAMFHLWNMHFSHSLVFQGGCLTCPRAGLANFGAFLFKC